MSDDVVSGIVQALVIVVTLSGTLVFLWNAGPGAKIESIEKRIDASGKRMEKIIESMRQDHYENRERIQRLEILAEQAQAEIEGRARRGTRGI
jgi:hypothetical protein